MKKFSSDGYAAIQLDSLTKKFGDYRAVSSSLCKNTWFWMDAIRMQ
jgi:hypothetical protein